MKEIEIREESNEKDKAINSLYAEKIQLEKKYQSLLNMYCFTLGIAYNAHPDNAIIQKLMNGAFGGEDGPRQ